MPGNMEITYEQFLERCSENRRAAAHILKNTGFYTPFVFRGEDRDDWNFRKHKICLIAGYRVISDLTKILKPRRTGKYKAWQKSVKIRDGHTCTICGNKENLHVHHIVELFRNPRLSVDVDNGLTLCSCCHKRVHKK